MVITTTEDPLKINPRPTTSTNQNDAGLKSKQKRKLSKRKNKISLLASPAYPMSPSYCTTSCHGTAQHSTTLHFLVSAIACKCAIAAAAVPGEYTLAWPEDAPRVEPGLAIGEPLPPPAEVAAPAGRGRVVGEVLFRAEARRGGAGEAAVAEEELLEAVVGAPVVGVRRPEDAHRVHHLVRRPGVR